MANKVIYAVYQDCVLCGAKGQQVIADCAAKGIEIIKVSFVSPLGRELCEKAVMSHGIKSMPFYTDNRTFSTSLKSFTNLHTEPKTMKIKASTRKNKNVRKGKKNGTIPKV